MTTAAVEVHDLVVRAPPLAAVRGVSFAVPTRGRLGLVGESGSGKTLTALAMMGLLPAGLEAEGRILHDGVDLMTLSDKGLSRRRGRTLSMVFQDPLSALNPVQRVGEQIASVVRRHTGAGRRAAAEQTVELARQMKLPLPEEIVRAYPHQLSGGQQQRLMIAMALACYPQLIIADEPTTALDVTVQKEVLRLLDDAVSERGSALLLITHDLPVVAAMCDTVAVMYGGSLVEIGPTIEVFRGPRHPYTKGLLDSQPYIDEIAADPGFRLRAIPGAVPPLHAMPTGCAFRPRCALASGRCAERPPLEGAGRRAACWHPITEGPRSAVG